MTSLPRYYDVTLYRTSPVGVAALTKAISYLRNALFLCGCVPGVNGVTDITRNDVTGNDVTNITRNDVTNEGSDSMIDGA